MKKKKNYHDLYLKCDVLLLADVFEKFRNNSLKNYGLCSSHYLSVKGLSWDAMLKMTKIELEFIPAPDMFTFFEKGIRSGISYISNRYSKANNKYLTLIRIKWVPGDPSTISLATSFSQKMAEGSDSTYYPILMLENK